jgi:diguanylate cyclase (GGDEF)-like protein
VQRQAVTDELTGLYNHRRFQEAMVDESERARRFEQPMGLVMLDIDNFKKINDTYGHQQGDRVLAEVARVLRESSREIDAPARYGGEELAVVLPQTDLEGAYLLAERIRQGIAALELPLDDGRASIVVTASLGVASLPESADAPRELLAAADEALYEAKRSGKNKTVRAVGRV